MGLLNWCQDSWLMMLRTKPQYISILGRKRSSIKSPPKLFPRDGKYGKIFGVFMCIVTMCCSISYGVLLVLSEDVAPTSLTTYAVSLAIAGIAAISGGLCLSEYINNKSQETPSIYSCCYQYTSEVLAFFIGWMWIVSQIAVISAICKILTVHINKWSDDIPRKFLEAIFYDYAEDVPSLVFVLLFILFILTGFGDTIVWYAFFVPIAFGMIAATYTIGCIIDNSESALVGTLSFEDIKGINEVLTKSAICILFFTGPQNLLRIPLTYARKSTTAVLGPLNGIALMISFIFITAASFSDKLVNSSSNELLNLVSNILCTISLCSMGIEAFYPLHYAIEDMSSDGLLFRSFSKKWKPFCFTVLSPVVHVLSFIAVGLMSVFIPLFEVLNLAVVFPLLVNSIVPYLVLNQRYRDNSSWQYEPMFHTSASSVIQDRTRKKRQEFQYSNAPGFDITDDCEISTTCIEENLSDSTSTDTDVDAIVQQYKEQTQVANTTLENTIGSNQTPEPSPSSAFRAKLCIIILIVISLVVSLTLNFANSKDPFSAMIIILLCALFSTIVQSFLICLPQNQTLDNSKGCCAKIPSMPWTPGMGSLLTCPLLMHSLINTWKISLGCFIVGALLYFSYGIRSSTAANSFYNMRTTHITLRPLPSYGNNCIPQIIPSQRKMTKLRRPKNLKSGSL